VVHQLIEHADQVGVGVASVITAVGAVLWPILKRLRRLQAKVDRLTDTSIQGILAATQKNIMAVAAVADQSKVFTLDIMFERGIYVSLPIIVGTTYSPWPGLEMTGIRSRRDATHYSLQTTQPVTLVRHSHEEHECVEVIDGSMTDLDSGKVFRAGEVWEIAPGLDHRVYFEAAGLYLVTIRPPLPHASERPINVDRLAELAEMV
jgi:hypothetical protein